MWLFFLFLKQISSMFLLALAASFSALSLENLSNVLFMLVNSYLKLIAPIIIAGTMIVWDDSVSECEKDYFPL